MNIGKLRRKIIIQQQTSTQDGYGGTVKTWTDVATVWASVEPLDGREFFAAQQVNSEVTTRIKLRYLAGVVSKMRIVHGTKTYDILSVIDPEERHKELQVMCKELN